MSGASSDAIVVTGLGAVSGLGMDVAANWAACRDGHGAIAITEFAPDPAGPPPFTAPIAMTPKDAAPHIEGRIGRRFGVTLDPVAIYALGAAQEAIAQSGLARADLEKAAAVFGQGMAGMHTLEESFARFFGRKTTRVHPLTVPKVMVSAPVSAIAIEFGVRGPVFTASSACASSGHAIAQGAMLLRAGRAEIAIVGGSEAIASPACLAAWEGLRAVTQTTCRPFSKGRDGMAIGEGAACLVLETKRHAQARGADILFELCGVGMTSDAQHWTQPSLEGAVGAMREACAEAHYDDSEDLLISAHGTGTPLNDENEAAAIHALFGARAKDHVVIATKSAHGHLIGATTALQAVLGLMALKERAAPPILNFLERDPACDLNLALGEAQPISARTLLVNSFAFGGLNASLLFRAA